MDSVTSLPSSRSSGSKGVSTPFEYVALMFAIMASPLADLLTSDQIISPRTPPCAGPGFIT